ncbi:N-methyl-L-tryptophan oxidase [Rahnella sp. SL6]|uniref:N-methyl-L-tryptophan oxidase n=1 Tax=Rahnella perminowiae TaxID=2816244 RepID=UPI001C2660F9|nr:N-methyl-L-tryptophan oxidase [Rahnella perminowiae]MBU9808490.1 N-methyl-L-tryptophan oxidase [Rahnella perminowiae]
MDYDLIIVGSGSVGSAAGYYATRSGLKVLMIDSAMPPHQAGSHHGETRLIRHAYGEGSRYVPMLLRAQTLWDELAELSNDKIFHRSGVLNIGPENSEFIRNVKHSAETYRLVTQSLSSTEIREKWPLFTLQDGYCGVYEPNSGFLQSEMAVSAYIRLAREAGCAQLFNCPVESINWLDDSIEVTTIDGVYRGAKLVVAAGTWVTKILPALPVKPLRKVFAWFHADGRYSEENHFPAFTLETLQGDQYYGFPSVKDELKLGKHNGGQWITEPEQRKSFGSFSQDGTESFNFFRHFLPGVGVSLRGASCTYDMTADEDFIIDTLPERENTLVISGLSGHGFKFASVLGEIVSLFGNNRPIPFDLTPFSLNRFN